jgi:radical SAM protein (TIGR01212 family)
MNFPLALQERWHKRRYNSYNRALKEYFNARVYKIGLRMDFTCPNRDGTVAIGGCIYCNNDSHTPQDYRPRRTVTQQLEQGAAAIRHRHRAEKFIAYFQSYTNTYDSVVKLEKLYREALDFPGVVGLAVATRPDCLPDDVLRLLAAISQHTYFWLEIGLESMQERTLQWVNRGHGLGDYIDAVERCKSYDLRVCTHLILGFPGETRAEVLATPALFNTLGIDGVKLHNLHVIRNTVLERFYQRGDFTLHSLQDYVSLVVDFLELLNPHTIIHRLTGETYRAITVAPEWSINKIGVVNAIQKELDQRDTWQGRRFEASSVDLPNVYSQGAHA